MENFDIFKQENWPAKKYDGRKKEFRGITKNEWEIACKKRGNRWFKRWCGVETRSPLRQAYEAIKEWAKPEHGNYQKVAMYGHTHLYLCSPIYGHADYNKSRLLPIKGNEDKCEWLIAVSDRIANQK